ncbi:MAG: TfoX/Sxy family protein [Pseudomonadota bacterium]|jgi:DNA transformation protein|nr:TfoX/Sxy family protein [Pseudomonadota bacterium]
MAVDQGLIDWVAEAMEPVGVVTTRAMMGGATLYCGGTIFAIVALDALWFKADAVSDALWDAAECPRFTFEMGEGRIGSMNYRRAPDDVYDDADELRRWGLLGIAAGERAPVKKPKARKKV